MTWKESSGLWSRHEQAQDGAEAHSLLSTHSLLEIQTRGMASEHAEKENQMSDWGTLPERDIFEAIALLKDENLVWSSDMEVIRRNLAGLMERIMQVEWHFVEPEIGDLALNLIRDKERQLNARESDTTAGQGIAMQDSGSPEFTGEERQRHSCCCACRP